MFVQPFSAALLNRYQLDNISYANKTRSEKEIIDFYVLPQFARFKEILDEGIKKDPSFANSAIVKFCYSIIKDNKLFKELEEVSIPTKNSSVNPSCGLINIVKSRNRGLFRLHRI